MIGVIWALALMMFAAAIYVGATDVVRDRRDARDHELAGWADEHIPTAVTTDDPRRDERVAAEEQVDDAMRHALGIDNGQRPQNPEG